MADPVMERLQSLKVTLEQAKAVLRLWATSVNLLGPTHPASIALQRQLIDYEMGVVETLLGGFPEGFIPEDIRESAKEMRDVALSEWPIH